MFIGIEKLTCLQTLPHFVASRDKNCLIGKLGGLKNLGAGNLQLYGLGKVTSSEETRQAKFHEKSTI